MWNDCTYFSLPIPQSSVPSASPPAADVGYLGCVSGEVLLKEYWSRGSIKVEVMDGDRFNEDTHLGEVIYYDGYHIADELRFHLNCSD